MLVFSLVTVVLNGIHMPTQLVYLLVALTLVGVSLLAADPLLQFLTVKKNATSRLVTITVLCVAILYALDLFMPQFSISGFIVKAQTIGMVDLNYFTLGSIWTMILYGFTTGVLSVFIKSLN